MVKKLPFRVPPEISAGIPTSLTFCLTNVVSHLAYLSCHQVRERCLPLLKESQSLLAPLEEMEKNISGFYQALEKASHVTSSSDAEGPVDFKHKCQVIPKSRLVRP